MTDKMVVFVTCETAAEARRIAESVVNDKFAACVNITSGVQSCFMWEKKLTWSDEVLLIMKTSRGRFGQLEARVRELHSYKVPEIVAVEIDSASDKYLEWIDLGVGG